MQLRALLVLAFAARASSAFVAFSAENTAREWLRQHEGGPDELAELKAQNPTAYALVKALLTKRSLGLLDPKHPTASFSKQQPQDTEEHGPEVYAKFASPGELEAHRQEEASAPKVQAAVPYADVQTAGSHKDWMNWKPQASALDDDAMVQNVLGAVAELKGKKAGFLTQKRSVDESPLAADEVSFSAEPAPVAPVAVAPVAPVAAVAPVAPAAPKQQASGYLDFSVMTGGAAEPAAEPSAAATPTAARAPKENSYLAGLNLNEDIAPAAQAPPSKPATSLSTASSNNYLASFSWDDSKPAPQHVKPAAPKVVPNSHDAHLLEWLGVVQKAPAPTVKPAAKPSNPYILDLSD